MSATTAAATPTRPAVPRGRLAAEAAAIVVLVPAVLYAVDLYGWARWNERNAGAGPRWPDDFRAENWGWNVIGEASVVQSLLVVAALLALWASWRLRRPGADAAAGLVSFGASVMPAGRAAWGEAMSAELAGIEGRGERWRFALSCLRAELFAPRAPAAASPQATARRRTALLGLALAVVAIAAVVAVVAAYPLSTTSPARELEVYPLVFPALGFAAALWLVVTAPGALARDSLARRVGVIGGLAVGVAVLVGGAFALVFVHVLAFWAMLVVAAVAQSFRTGVRAALWATAFAVLTTVPAFVASAVVSFARTGEIWYGDGVDRGDIVYEMASWVVPSLVGVMLPIAVIGAALGALVGPGRLTGMRARLAR